MAHSIKTSDARVAVMMKDGMNGKAVRIDSLALSLLRKIVLSPFHVVTKRFAFKF